jgi:hypothetical protein
MLYNGKLGEDDYQICETREEFEQDVRLMGWDNGTQFEQETGWKFEELKGKRWTVIGGFGKPAVLIHGDA